MALINNHQFRKGLIIGTLLGLDLPSGDIDIGTAIYHLENAVKNYYPFETFNLQHDDEFLKIIGGELNSIIEWRQNDFIQIVKLDDYSIIHLTAHDSILRVYQNGSYHFDIEENQDEESDDEEEDLRTDDEKKRELKQQELDDEELYQILLEEQN